MAKALVGLEGRGEATIFGGTTNPIAIYAQTQAARQRRQQQEQLTRQKQVDDLLDYNEKFRPETKFADLNYTLANSAKEVSDITRQRLRETNNPSLVMAEAQNMQREVLALGKEMDGWKADIEGLDKTIAELQGKGILKPEAKQAVRYGWRNQDGSIKSIPEIRQWANKMGETLNDPSIYDPKGTAKNWVSGLKDQSTHLYSKMKGAIGYNDDDVETTIKSKLNYRKDANGLILDENGNAIPEINDLTLNLAMQDPYMRTVINANGGPTAETKKQYLQSLIEPGADITDFGDRQITRGQKIPEEDRFYYAYGSGFRTPVADLEKRDQRLQEIVTNNRPDLLSGLNDPNSDLSAVYANSNKQPLKPGEKPAMIIMAHTGRQEIADEQLAETIANTKDVWAKMALLQKAGIGVKTEEFPITTAEEKRRAKIAMSKRADKIDTKRAIGEDYDNFVEAKYQSDLRKNKTTKSGVVWKKP